MRLAILILLFSLPAQAYLSLMTDGEVLPKGEQSLGAESQFVFNKNDGINFAGRYNLGLSESLEFLGDIGTGATDFSAGGNIKFVPYPDYEGQPAIGFIFGATFANEEDNDFVVAQFKSFVSKRFDFDYGQISPYGALAYGVTLTNEEDAENPFQFIIGSKYKHFEWEDVYLYGELGTSLDEAFNYVSFQIVFLLDTKLSSPLDQYYD